MSQQIRHAVRHTPTTEHTDDALCAVLRANLHGHLYPHPRTRGRRRALRSLARAGYVERVKGGATWLGGWFAYSWV
jgi:hypothetical protein